MADRDPRLTRRGLLLLAYSLATGWLLRVVADDLPWLEQTFTSLAALVPLPGGDLEAGATLAITLLAALGTLAAALGLWLSPHTGTGFGLVTVATVAWTLAPYAQLPYARMLGGPAGQTYTAPVGVWLLAGLLVVLATVEMTFCAREHVVQELRGRGLVQDTQAPALSSIRWAHRFGLASSLVAGGTIVALFAGLHPYLGDLAGGLDLLWAPAIAGLVVGAALWLWARA